MSIIAKVLTIGVSLGMVLTVPTTVSAGDKPHSIGVAGQTKWPEIHEVIAKLAADYTIPIHASCHPEDRCIVLSHYYEKTNIAGYTTHTSTEAGEGHIYLNDYRDNGHFYRIALLMHEMGHALGLGHTSDCMSSMKTPLQLCGYYTIGYNEEQRQKLEELWR